jgi:mercuric ion transport protein
LDQNSKLIGTGAAGAVLSLLCCVTPVLAVLLGALGLTALVAKLDYLLIPVFVASIALVIFCARAPASELRREDAGANLADRRFDHHMPPLRASGDRTNAGGTQRPG